MRTVVERDDLPPESGTRKCFQDPNRDHAWCAVHEEVPDWHTDIPGYRGPAGWVCHSGGQTFGGRVQ